MLVLRSIAFNICFYTLMIAMMIVGLPLMLISAQAVRNLARAWAQASVWLLNRMCGVSIEIRGRENLPAGGFILASKHQSFLDILVLVPLVPRFVFVMKRELTWIPIFGLFLLRAGMIPIDRSKGRAVLQQLTERVNSALGRGLQLIIFPEGTRRPPGATPAYKSGIGHLYIGTGAPCVPVALNSGEVWPRRSFLRVPGQIVVEILPPIGPGKSRDELLSTLQYVIETTSDRLLAVQRTKAAA